MKRNDWTVGDEGIRPAGKPDECFYCHSKVGAQHGDVCVIRQRTVVVEMTMQYVITVPEHWTEENIEFHRNESSWCSSNASGELSRLFEHIAKDDTPCLCCRGTRYAYVREATPTDEEECGVSLADLPS